MIKLFARILAILVLVAGAAFAYVHKADIHPLAIKNAIAANPLAPLIFIGLQIAASLLFVPRTVLGLAAGLLFGLVWGSIWAIVGAVAGAAAGFALVRWLGWGGTLDHSPGIGRLIERAEHGGWRAVAIVRLTPLPHSLANAALALTNIRWRDYLIGSLIGMLPMTIVQVDIGASGNAVLQGKGAWLLGCLLLAGGLAATLLIHRYVKKNPDA